MAATFLIAFSEQPLIQLKAEKKKKRASQYFWHELPFGIYIDRQIHNKGHAESQGHKYPKKQRQKKNIALNVNLNIF